MRLKLAIVALFSVGLIVGLWAWIGSGPGDQGALGSGPTEALQPGAEPGGLPELTEALPPVPALVRETADERRSAAAATANASVLDSWKGQLAGVVGRVIDSYGTPRPNLRVDLLQADWTLLVPDDLRELGADVSLSLGFAMTDAEGRFQIDGAWSGSFHGLGIDLGGQRATLRVIEHALHHGEQTDLGDIVLAPFGVLVGQVVDEEGKPIGGARVRVGALPEELLGARIHDLRADSLIGVSPLLSAAQPAGLIAVPGWLRGHLDSLPVPTTRSRKDGTFRLEGVPLTRVLGGIDLPGFVGLPLGPLEVTDGEQNLGVLTLTRGRTLRGTVLDAAGEPAPDFEVFAGAELPLGPVALLQPCGKSDAQGRFTGVGVPPEGRAVAIARRAEGEPYVATIAEDGGELVIRVPSSVDLDVRVVDGEGAALSAARLRLTPVGTDDSNFMYNPLSILMLQAPSRGEEFREIEAGLYRRSKVSHGAYELRAEVPGFAPAHSRIEVDETTGVTTLTLGAGVSLALTVVDGVSGEPVRGARAVIVQPDMPLLSTLALGWSDAQGEVKLGPFEPLSEESSERSPLGKEPPMLVVEHPSYPSHELPLGQLLAAPVVRLQAGGSVRGLIHWGGAVPERLYTILLQYRDADDLAEIFHIPRFGLSRPDGEFHFANLRAGKYRIEVFERFLTGDLLGLARDQVEPVRVHRETLEVIAGQATELQIDLSPSGMGPSGRISGTVRVDGTPLEGARVEIGGGRNLSLSTDAWGHFDSGDIPALRGSNVTITGDLSYYDGGRAEHRIHSEFVRLEAGEVHELDLDLSPRILNVEVVDVSSRAPLAGARVMIHSERSYRGPDVAGQTDSAGGLRLMILQNGPQSLEVHLDGYVVRHVQVEPKPDDPDEVVKIELSSATPCAGRVVLSSRELDPGDWLYLQVSSVEGGGDAGAYLQDGNHEFSFDNLGAGTYQARLYASGFQSEKVTFELAEHGDRNLILRF